MVERAIIARPGLVCNKNPHKPRSSGAERGVPSQAFQAEMRQPGKADLQSGFPASQVEGSTYLENSKHGIFERFGDAPSCGGATALPAGSEPGILRDARILKDYEKPAEFCGI